MGGVVVPPGTAAMWRTGGEEEGQIERRQEKRGKGHGGGCQSKTTPRTLQRAAFVRPHGRLTQCLTEIRTWRFSKNNLT